MKKTFKFLIYTLYCISAASFFLYYLFPSETISRYIESNVNLLISPLNLSILQVKPAFPPGINLKNARIKHQNNIIFAADTSKITPRLLTLMGQNPIFHVQSNANGGTINSRIYIDRQENSRRFKVDTQLSGIMIKNNPALNNLLNLKISGVLDGRIIYTSKKLSADMVEAALYAADCRIELLTSFFNLKHFAFKSIKIDFSANTTRVKIKECVFNSDQFDGSVFGSITLRSPSKDSIINLSGTLELHPGFLMVLSKSFPANRFPAELKAGNRITFRLGGTLESPTFL